MMHFFSPLSIPQQTFGTAKKVKKNGFPGSELIKNEFYCQGKVLDFW